MEHTCYYCGARITPNQEKTTIALFSRAVCSKNECTKKAQDEANKQTETLMTPRAKVLAFLAHKGFEEQKGKPGFFILEGATKIAIDLNHQVAFPGIPVIGVLQTNGDIIEEGHGIQRIGDIRQEIEAILKSKSKPQAGRQSSPTSGSRKPEPSTLNNLTDVQVVDAVTQPVDFQSRSIDKPKSTSNIADLQSAGKPERSNRDTTPPKFGTPDTLTEEVKDDNRQTKSEQDDKNVLSTTHAKDQKIEVKGGQESPQPKGNEHEEKETKTKKKEGDNKTMEAKVVKTCSVCGLELSGARALECFQKDKPFICEKCEDKQGETMNEDTEEMLRQSDMESLNGKKSNLPAKKKQELVIGTCEAVATQYGIPVELANLFFMRMNEGLYIKNPGLLYLAGKKGYSRIEITTTYDEKTQEWSAECKIYPKLTKDILEGISKLDKDLQKIAFDFATQPTNGTGRASKASVKMATMHPFLKEMAQTRAQNRCLRAFTSYGGTSLEELPEAQIERD